jgi:RNA polymerase sigma-70 factor (ECF subfamily)
MPAAIPPYDTSTLLQEVATGSSEAFKQLFERYEAKVNHAAMLITGSRELSEDVVQDVFTRVWLKRAQLPSIGNLEGWLFVITRNQAITVMNQLAARHGREDEVARELPTFTADAAQELDAKNVQQYIHEALHLLTEQQRKVFVMSKMEGMSRDEIAAALSLSTNTVKVHLLHASRIVRVHLTRRLELPFLVVLGYFLRG